VKSHQPNSRDQSKINDGRRELLKQVARLCGGAVAFGVASAEAACIDPDDLTGGQLSMRKDAGYQDTYPDDKKTCRQCEFYKSRSDDCGDCRAIGGPVSGGGHCNEWMERVKK
jgi:High potential iron-sulfur protein